MGLIDRFKNAWNAFINVNKNNQNTPTYINLGYSSSSRPDKPYVSVSNERSIVTAICNRIAIDASSAKIVHTKVDKKRDERFIEIIDDELNKCLTVEANKDQTAKAFIRDIVISMLDEGVIAIVPVDTSINPLQTSSYAFYL